MSHLPAVATVALGAVLVLVATTLDDSEPTPPEPTYQQRLTQCVQMHQSLYAASVDLSRAICINYLTEPNEDQ